MNDDFNNFFDDQRQPEPEHKTPVYHTPEPKANNKTTIALIVSISLAIVMCVVVLANVLVLATLKQTIANQYQEALTESMREQYAQAINDSLESSSIVDDITEQATADALYALQTSIGNVANEKTVPSVARLYMYTETNANANSDSYSGLASGFIITDTNDAGTLQRYLVTNAHCVRYEKATSHTTNGGGWFGFGQTTTTYTWESYGTILCMFENDNTIYKLEVVAYGSYTGDYLNAENNQADLALLRFVGTQPSNTDHPSLEIAYDDNVITRGMEVALVGNPKGLGDNISISVGVVSQKDITISSWGSGTFIMTDAAINGGNSGGPMINSNGIVIGVVESKLVSTDVDNMGFALSAGTLRSFLTWAQSGTNNQLGSSVTLNLK